MLQTSILTLYSHLVNNINCIQFIDFIFLIITYIPKNCTDIIYKLIQINNIKRKFILTRIIAHHVLII